jgi:surface antigen
MAWSGLLSGSRLVIAVAALSLGGCAANGYDNYGTKETIGTVAGAALGAWAGSAIDHDGTGGAIAMAGGALLGGYFGNQIGRGLDKADRLELERAQYQALEYGRSGTSSDWRNPDSGNYGSFTPREAYETRDGVCRPYSQTVTIDGRSERLNGIACRDSSGRWREASAG